MKVLNIMLSRKLGGIEQSFLDYSFALKSQNINVINVTSVFAKVNSSSATSIKLPNLGPWDFFSMLYLIILVVFIKPDLIIVHGNRAVNFARKAGKRCPIVGIAHNYKVADLLKCNYIIALTEHMREYLIKQHFEESCIQVIPNMINIRKDPVVRKFHSPVVIGTMTRFVKKKGVDILLKSLAKLRDQHYNFKAIIGGGGEEESNLLKLVQELKLEQYVSFVGWINNKEKFFNEVDIFCVPSLHEPFGIIILEAMVNSMPIVSTNTEGPSEIIRNRHDGLLCTAGSVDDLTLKLAYLLINSMDAKKYAENAYVRVNDKYTTSVVAPQLANFVKTISKT
ncbi:Glycosyltransferase family 4 protein [Candidatus Trichorickettsia mobilis]|uniref:Glycosyltransferase family 4 protein n=1 Tax=Candidatus Trichorickettsia mobilis TaxID=1346319 RepID=A0ABZ0US71_9RICK|nr:glycosyltransferase family 4 protein [Candidatus Trichorickettsia mobilis]WPY00493.1 Glycosyltransferase family 4 protein [Candidatus Trichorickettsia mobilis]